MSSSLSVTPKTKIHVFTGDILHAPSKNILISIGEDRIMKWATAKAVLSALWPWIQDLLLEDIPFEKWDTRLYEYAGYACIFGRPFDYRIIQMTILWVESVIRNALKICDERWLETLAISALVSNYMGGSDDQINDISLLALKTYFSDYPNSVVKDVYLVNFDREIFRLYS